MRGRKEGSGFICISCVKNLQMFFLNFKHLKHMLSSLYRLDSATTRMEDRCSSKKGKTP